MRKATKRVNKDMALEVEVQVMALEDIIRIVHQSIGLEEEDVRHMKKEDEEKKLQ